MTETRDAVEGANTRADQEAERPQWLKGQSCDTAQERTKKEREWKKLTQLMWSLGHAQKSHQRHGGSRRTREEERRGRYDGWELPQAGGGETWTSKLMKWTDHLIVSSQSNLPKTHYNEIVRSQRENPESTEGGKNPKLIYTDTHTGDKWISQQKP